jgi:hypothetical protein
MEAVERSREAIVLRNIQFHDYLLSIADFSSQTSIAPDPMMVSAAFFDPRTVAPMDFSFGMMNSALSFVGSSNFHFQTDRNDVP